MECIEQIKVDVWYNDIKFVQIRLVLFTHICNSLQWHHSEHDGVSNHQHQDCLRNRLFRRRSKKTSKLRITGLRQGNSSVTGEFLTQRTSNAENCSIWWRHHVLVICKHTADIVRNIIMLIERMALIWMSLLLCKLNWLRITGTIRLPIVSRACTFSLYGLYWLWL